jgi:voltage-gated potassium channel
MTVVTLSTIGYGETHPLSQAGRGFTMVLIFVGLSLGTLVIGRAWRGVVERQLERLFNGQRKMKEEINSASEHTIFCGYSRLGRLAAQELRKDGVTVIIIENDEERVEDAQRAGFLTIRGDATIDETLVLAGIARAKRLISLLPRDSDNLYVILTSRELNPSLYIVSRAEDEVGEKRLKRAGVDRIISTYRLAARKLADGLMRPFVTEFFEIAGSGDEGWKIEEIRISPLSPVCGKSLGDLSWRQKVKVGIAAILSPTGELELNPSGETVIQAGATLIAIGWQRDLAELESVVAP